LGIPGQERLAAQEGSLSRTGEFQKEETVMAIRLGDTAPDFQAQSTEGEISFHDWIGDGWAVLFSHP